MPALTARRAICQALRDPLSNLGLRARAAGWWTLNACEDLTYVVAAGTASEGMRAGHARATLYVGARQDALEAAVASVCGISDSYRTRTVTMNIGYTMPARTWQHWNVTQDLAPAAASEMAEVVRDHGLPFLGSLIRDRAAVLAMTGQNWMTQSCGLARHILMSANFPDDHGADARTLIAEAYDSLKHRTDPAAEECRAVLEILAKSSADAPRSTNGY